MSFFARWKSLTGLRPCIFFYTKTSRALHNTCPPHTTTCRPVISSRRPSSQFRSCSYVSFPSRIHCPKNNQFLNVAPRLFDSSSISPTSIPPFSLLLFSFFTSPVHLPSIPTPRVIRTSLLKGLIPALSYYYLCALLLPKDIIQSMHMFIVTCRSRTRIR